MANEFKTLGGYAVKDATAREQIVALTEKHNRDISTLSQQVDTKVGEVEKEINSFKNEVNNTTTEITQNVNAALDAQAQQHASDIESVNATIQQQAQQHASDIQAVASDIQAVNDALDEKADALSAKDNILAIKEAKRYYIDNVNGNDENPGTSDAPFKTLSRWLEQINKGEIDLRCYILQPGIYTIPTPYQAITGCAFHITGNVDGVILNFESKDDVSFAFYGVHYNLKNITIQSNSQEIYWETCSLSFDTVKFMCDCIFYGCFCSFEKPTFKKCRFDGCTGQIHHPTWTTNDNGSTLSGDIVTCKIQRGCNLRFYGTHKFEDITDPVDKNIMFDVLDSVVYFEPSSIQGATNYHKGFKVYSAMVFMLGENYNKLASHCSIPITYSNNMNLFVNGNNVIGTPYVESEV